MLRPRAGVLPKESPTGGAGATARAGGVCRGGVGAEWAGRGECAAVSGEDGAAVAEYWVVWGGGGGGGGRREKGKPDGGCFSCR